MLNESKIHWGCTYSRPCCNLMHTEGRIHNPAHVEKQWGLNRRLQRKEKRRTFDHLCCLSESQPKTLVASRIHYSNWLQLTPTLALATTRTHIKRTHRPVNNLMRNGFAWLPFASEWRGKKTSAWVNAACKCYRSLPPKCTRALQALTWIHKIMINHAKSVWARPKRIDMVSDGAWSLHRLRGKLWKSTSQIHDSSSWSCWRGRSF